MCSLFTVHSVNVRIVVYEYVHSYMLLYYWFYFVYVWVKFVLKNAIILQQIYA